MAAPAFFDPFPAIAGFLACHTAGRSARGMKGTDFRISVIPPQAGTLTLQMLMDSRLRGNGEVMSSHHSRSGTQIPHRPALET
jgi:hypothetical protein